MRNRKQESSDTADDYYDEVITEFSVNIRRILRYLIMHITAGNTVYPTTLDELALRRRYQNLAIISCEQLHQEFLYCEDVLPVKASVFIPYIEMILFEVRLLKGWKKSNAKFEALIMKKGKEEERQNR